MGSRTRGESIEGKNGGKCIVVHEVCVTPRIVRNGKENEL